MSFLKTRVALKNIYKKCFKKLKQNFRLRVKIKKKKRKIMNKCRLNFNKSKN